MDQSVSELSEAELAALSSVIGEVNMLRANGSEQSSIATEDALRYLRAAKYNSSRAIEIYKNYQKHREVYGLDDVKPYREPLNSEIESGKIKILGTSDDEDSPILLFTGSKHDSKYSKLEAAMQLLFHVLDKVASSDSAQNKGIVFLLDLRDSSQDTKYLRNFLSVLLTGYPLFLKMAYVVGAPIWVKPILMTFRQLNKIKFVHLADLLQYFSDYQLPASLGGKFHPYCDPTLSSPVSPNHAPPRPKLPRQQSHPDNLCDAGEEDRVGEKSKLVGNLVSQFNGRGRARAHSGSAADKAHLRPLPPQKPPLSQKPPSSTPSRCVNRPLPPRSKPQLLVNSSPAGESGKLKPKNPFQQPDKLEDKPLHRVKHLRPQVGSGNTGKATPSSPSPSSEPSAVLKGLTVSDEPLACSQATPTAVRTGNTGIASRIQNFERQTDSNSSSFHNARLHSRSVGGDDMGALRYTRAGRQTRALVSVQIGEEHGGDRQWERGGEREKEKREQSREDELRKRREEEMRRLRREEDRLQRERREKNSATQAASTAAAHNHQSTRSSLLDDYENVELDPPSAVRAKLPVSKASKASPAEPRRRNAAEEVKKTQRDNATGYENVAILYVRSPSHSPELPKMASGQPGGGGGGGGGGRGHKAQESKEKGGVGAKQSPKMRHQYENITILTAAGPIPYLQDTSSSEDSEDFSGDECPAPKEVIYENFGFDKGNQMMTAGELEKHLSQQEKKGISAEYLRIKNEPLAHPYIACKLKCNVPKNRYKDVVCYDNSRVILETIPGIEGSDYIHANYVSSYKKSKAFILTQGPIKKTLVDFWRMVWEQHVHVVVMTTKCVELGRHKCSQYWPDEGVVRYGNVTVTVAKLQQCDGYELRNMKISCRGTERTIKHFQFLAWPDYGVPTSGQAVLNLIFAVREAQARMAREARTPSSVDQRAIIHCSAGVGRSGAFCVINNCIDEFKEKGVVNVQAAVRNLRLQRAYAIQTDEQYFFCYRTVLQYMKSPTHH